MMNPWVTACERWRPIPGTNGLYYASDFGRIKSYCVRGRRGRRRDTPRVLKAAPDRDGYLRLVIAGNNRSVHSLVWVAFRGPVPDGLQVDHIAEGNKQDNRLANLQLLTHRENSQKRWSNKLTFEQAREIERRYAAGGITQRELGADYGISHCHVSNIVAGKTWRADREIESRRRRSN